jgi:hypothetical protein
VRDAAVKQIALIVDEDLGFVCWLGQMLAKAGCQAVPALDCQSALDLVEDLGLRINVVIVNPSIGGADKLTKVLSGRNRSLKVVTIRDAGMNNATGMVRAQGTLNRSIGSSKVWRQEYLRNIRRVLKSVRIAA